MKYLIGLLIIVAVVYGGRISLKKPAAPAPAEKITESRGVTVINMTGQNFRFNPDEITVNQGEKVRVVLTALDMPHDFDVDELGVDGPIASPGETIEIEFTADQAGEFKYYCSVGSHRQNGMVGKLVVL